MSLSIDVTKIDKSKLAKGKYLNLTVSVQDETNQWGQDVSAYHEQSKEEREAKEKRNYLGNGKVFWSDSNVTKAEPKQATEGEDDLIFYCWNGKVYDFGRDVRYSVSCEQTLDKTVVSSNTRQHPPKLYAKTYKITEKAKIICENI